MGSSLASRIKSKENCLGSFMYRKPLLGKGTNWITKYTSSLDGDSEIYEYVIDVMKAHVLELLHSSNISKEIAGKIITKLNKAYDLKDKISSNTYEDVHEALEAYMLSELGDVAGWISLGRSRNDHVATAIKLKLKEVMLSTLVNLLKVRRVILAKALENVNAPFITHTHTQPAQVTSVAHYLLSIDEGLKNYIKLGLFILNEFIDKSPLGSGASVGSSIHIDRCRLGERLCFSDIEKNTLYATGHRDYMFMSMSFILGVLLHIARYVNDMIIFTHPEINYVNPPKDHLATSSLMPHKKNLVTLEVLRARISEIIGNIITISSILKNLPSGYSLDLQEITKTLWLSFKILNEGLNIFSDFIIKVKFNFDVIKESIKKHKLMITNVTEELATSKNIPYRKSHQIIASSLRKGIFNDEVAKLIENSPT